MARVNPFAGDPARAEKWELGYLAGFAQPEEDHLPPFAPDLLEAYLQGELAGRDDRRLLPPQAGGVPADGSEFDAAEVAEHFGLHAFEHFAVHHLFKHVGGLVSLVVTALQVPTDSPMRPLEDDWTGPVDQEGDTYLAVCPREDHPTGEPGVTSEGYWCGLARFAYIDALFDWKEHGHDEAGIARCSVSQGECGLVWPGPGQE